MTWTFFIAPKFPHELVLVHLTFPMTWKYLTFFGENQNVTESPDFCAVPKLVEDKGVPDAPPPPSLALAVTLSVFTI